MPGWGPVAQLSDLPTDTGCVVEVEGRQVALFRVGDEVFAMENECPHREGPIGEGDLEDGVVTCPWHAWQVDVRTGAVAYRPELCAKTYPCNVDDDGRVFVRLP
jgi:nitrite reductase (NADH) small subunit